MRRKEKRTFLLISWCYEVHLRRVQCKSKGSYDFPHLLKLTRLQPSPESRQTRGCCFPAVAMQGYSLPPKWELSDNSAI